MEGDISGDWHGSRWEGAGRVLWLTRLGENGEFDVLFHTCYAGNVVRTEEQSGRAEFSDGRYRTEIDQIVTDGDIWNAESSDEQIVYTYEITRLTADTMHYQSLEYGNRFEARRVSADFELACPPARQIVNTNPGGRSGRDAWLRRGVEEETNGSDADSGATDD